MEFIRAAGKDICAGNSPILLRGFGLGGWFLPEGYMWKLYKKCDRPRRMEAMIEGLCGKEYADSFWENYLGSYITEKDIEFIAREGFNSVRLPLNGRHLYEKKDGVLSLNTGMLRRIDEVISWCGQHRIYVILDMHGAPGGQTGQNIDDSEADQPYLFMYPQYGEELVFLWKELAKRYCEEPAIAGYDLLNEPLPNFFSQYNDKLLPLYRRLIREIREIDKKHMIILEGLHWATDFSVFDSFTKEEAADNIMLQFHKYWNNPDAESLQGFMKKAGDLSVPLFMGEGGENNCDWYTTAFPMYEQQNISWSFWSYKKMACTNSPVTFDIPEGWDELIGWIDGHAALDSKRAEMIFNHFLHCIQNPRINKKVLNALKRELPVKIPCEAYNTYRINLPRIPGAAFRLADPVTIIFENGKTGDVNFRGHAGEEQPKEENLLVQLFPGDSVGYLFYHNREELKVTVSAEGPGDLAVSTDIQEEYVPVGKKSEYGIEIKGLPGRNCLRLACKSGSIKLDNIYLA
jgi:hypothetical protein